MERNFEFAKLAGLKLLDEKGAAYQALVADIERLFSREGTPGVDLVMMRVEQLFFLSDCLTAFEIWGRVNFDSRYTEFLVGILKVIGAPERYEWIRKVDWPEGMV